MLKIWHTQINMPFSYLFIYFITRNRENVQQILDIQQKKICLMD